jgi:site-specific recombinase XerD
MAAYQRDLKQFIEYAGADSTPQSLSKLVIRKYVLFLSSRKLAKPTIARKITSVRNFLAYLYVHGNTLADLQIYLSNPKFKRVLPGIIGEGEFPKILEVIQKNEKSAYTASLLLAAFELLYGCSLRLSELINLNYSDVIPSQGYLRIFGKGSKYRNTPISTRSAEVLKHFMNLKTVHTGKVFTKLTGEPITPRYIQRKVQHYLSLVSEVKKKSPHILRHSSATHMLDHQADLLAIKEILGHSNLSTTQIYTQVSVEKLKSVYKQTHPKS